MSKDDLKNFKNLVSDKKSDWKDKALWRKENKAWLERSRKIAIRILTEIRKQKEANGMTQKMLADQMGVSPQYINKIVKGNENLTLETIAKIENVLGITLIEIPQQGNGQIIELHDFNQNPDLKKAAINIAEENIPYSQITYTKGLPV